MARTVLAIAALALAGALLAWYSIAFAAAPAEPRSAQRIDMKVLLVGDSGTEPTFEAWKAQLKREGVPYDAVVASTDADITDAKLADYTANRAFYQGVILSYGNMPSLTQPERDALAKLERTFGVRELNDNTFPSAAYGLNAPSHSGNQDGSLATLTAAGKQAFPYLDGSFNIDTDTWGYRATPIENNAAGSFETLLAGPGGSSYLGVYTEADGREEMVSTIDSNQWQLHNQLLRHGMLNWVTRGVYLGHQRNYLGLQVDDVFIGDDGWDTEANATSYEEQDVIRMNAADVAKAAQWSDNDPATDKLRLDIVFNGLNSDPIDVLDGFKANASKFGWINHTFSHPNLDCSTRNFIAKQINDNRTFASANNLPIDPAELVTGEHSGLANTRPGNPGTIDPPSGEDTTPLATGGTFAAGSYDYAVTASTTNGETVASTTDESTAVAANGSVEVSWEAVCHASNYSVYRSPAGANSWSRIDSVPQPATPFTDAGPATVSFTDTGAAGTGVAPPTSNTAVVSPYAQNPNLGLALTDTGIKYTASDASKEYQGLPAGSSFLVDGTSGTRAVPRWPTNVYYNTATQTQQLDEYNWLYMPAPDGVCQMSDVTTCRTTPAEWAEYADNEKRIMFRHLMGNDPRPHYFHESNIAKSSDPEGGILYKVVDPLVADYRAAFADNAPLLQPKTSEIGDELARQDKWADDVAAGGVTAYLLDGKLHVSTTATTQVPLTGTTVGTTYGGHKSGWTEVQAGQDATFEGSDPANTAKPTISGTLKSGETLTAAPGTWTGSAPIRHGYQWQRCDAAGASCTDVAGANTQTYTLTDADRGSRLRVLVSGSNWIAAFNRAASEPTGVVPIPPANTAAPTISGTPQVRKQLDAGNGTWTGTEPISYTHQWQRCDKDGANCTNIDGATQASYTLLPADKGARLRIVVTAKNGGGEASKESVPTDEVKMAPENTAKPTISGVPQLGKALTADKGSWDGTEPISHAYQWQRCDASGGSCADIAGATQNSYTTTGSDVGARLRVVVTGTNGVGSEVAASDPTAAITKAPVNTAPPTISGTALSGRTLTANPGTWVGTAPIGHAYQWRRCDAAGNACANIAGAIARTYAVKPSDAGRRLRVTVTATNEAGVGTATSAATATVPAPPANVAAPAISGAARAGATLTASTGTWRGSAPIGFRHQWRRCDAAGNACANIAGATASRYVVGVADAARRLRVVVTASNAAGSASATSGATAQVATTPRILALSVAPRRFVAGGPSAARRGTRFSWRLSQPAGLTLRVQRALRGVRVGRACRPAGRHTRGRPSCRRYVTVGTLRRLAPAGAASVRFYGRLGRRTLSPGAYRVVGVAVGGGNLASAPRTAGFTVRAPARRR